jgi:hypothetical protein
MAVTKEDYTVGTGWTAAQLADTLFKAAFIDAGLMTDWFDSFELSGRQWRVMETTFDATETYGKTYYYFVFTTALAGVSIASGWDTATRVPTGTEFVDYHRLPSQFSSASANSDVSAYTISSPFNINNSTQIRLYRYTSDDDARQSWFVLQQGASTSRPFNFVSGTSTLFPWLDLDKGIISGVSNIRADVSSFLGRISFLQQENIRRALIYGTALTGNTNTSGNNIFHRAEIPSHTFAGIGANFNANSNNLSSLINATGMIALPVARASANPAYASDYIPICTGVPWSPFTPDPLAADFGIYMHYGANNMVFEDRFVVDPGIEEWEVLTVANNTFVNEGASSCFLARVV